MNKTLKSLLVVTVSGLLIFMIIKVYSGKGDADHSGISSNGDKVTGVILGEDNSGGAVVSATGTEELSEGQVDKGNYKSISDMNEFYEISADIPVELWDAKGIMAEYVNTQVNKAKSDWKIGGKAYNDEMQITKDFPDRAPMKYELNINYEKFASQKLGTVTYVMTAYEFTGGAHGGADVNTFTFNKDGSVAIDDILSLAKSNNDIALSKDIAAKLPAVLGEYSDAQMINDGLGLSYLKSDGVTVDKSKCNCDGFFYGSNLQKFVVLGSGIKFIMGQYQVAPYVAGMPEVKFSWAEIAKYVKIDLPLD